MDSYTKIPIVLKSGFVINPGATVSWNNGKATLHWVNPEGECQTSKISPIGAAKALEIIIPDENQIEEWVYDSVCESILGEQVEPDGIDHYGSPSWLLAFGLI